MPIIPNNQLCQSFKLWQSVYRKSDTSELSEGNGEVRKRAEKNFDEKRL